MQYRELGKTGMKVSELGFGASSLGGVFKHVEYSTDDGDTWVTYPSNYTIVLANVGDKVSFRCNTSSIYYGAYYSGQSNKTFTVTRNCFVYGNILSLVDYNTYLSQNATFKNLFNGCTSIYNHPTNPLLLPATYLTAQCYDYMFTNCSNLTTAPALPAETLAYECYHCMFYGCTSLTTAPALPATTLAQSCYNYMFNNCTNLTNVPLSLPATTLAPSCYSYMFRNCTSLTSAPALPATTLAQYCYSGMFSGCTSLITPPALPATTLTNDCYREMFQGCSNLNSVTCLATDISATNCTNNWLNGVAASGTFTAVAGTNWSSGANGIPSGFSPMSSPRALQALVSTWSHGVRAVMQISICN